MLVNIDSRGGALTWDDASIEKLARFALEYMDAPDACEVSISLVDADEIHELNRTYRGIDKPTDVLSFECDDPWDTYEPDTPIEIGDVVIALDVVDGQRAQFGTSLELVHSLLHLLGYDHIEETEALEMEALEKEILDAYGLTGIR